MSCLPDNQDALAQDYILQGDISDTLIVFAHGAAFVVLEEELEHFSLEEEVY